MELSAHREHQTGCTTTTAATALTIYALDQLGHSAYQSVNTRLSGDIIILYTVEEL